MGVWMCMFISGCGSLVASSLGSWAPMDPVLLHTGVPRTLCSAAWPRNLHTSFAASSPVLKLQVSVK